MAGFLRSGAAWRSRRTSRIARLLSQMVTRWVNASRGAAPIARCCRLDHSPRICSSDPTPNGARPVRILEQELAQFTAVGPITWHPDAGGQRISFLGRTAPEEWGFWTQPLAGGAAVRAEVSDAIRAELRAQVPERRNHKWAPDGDALYFEGTAQGVRNLWKVGVDPANSRVGSQP